MKRRLYFILPNTTLAKTVHNELLLARIEERKMHVIAREGTDLTDLPSANLLHKTDFIHSLQVGLPLGGLTGIILGALAINFGLVTAGSESIIMFATSILGLVLGGLASSMIAVSVPNTRHDKFASDIAAGKLLFIVDVPVTRVDEITQLVIQHHPEAINGGIEPNIPVFP